MACKQKIDKALSSMWDYVHVSSKLNKGHMERTMNAEETQQFDGLIRKFVTEINQPQGPDRGPPAKVAEPKERWTVQELESIVYDFITYDKKRRSEFQESQYKP